MSVFKLIELGRDRVTNMITFAVAYLTPLQGLPEGLRPEAPGLGSSCDTRHIRADDPRLWLVLFISQV